MADLTLMVKFAIIINTKSNVNIQKSRTAFAGNNIDLF